MKVKINEERCKRARCKRCLRSWQQIGHGVAERCLGPGGLIWTAFRVILKATWCRWECVEILSFLLTLSQGKLLAYENDELRQWPCFDQPWVRKEVRSIRGGMQLEGYLKLEDEEKCEHFSKVWLRIHRNSVCFRVLLHSLDMWKFNMWMIW